MKQNHLELDFTSARNIYFIGDLHGDFEALQFFLKEVNFNYLDQIISVGDLIDRGQFNLEVINFFLFTANARAVRGNHEDMAIQGVLNQEQNQYLSWIQNGGEWALKYPTGMIDGILCDLDELLPYAITVRHENTKIGVCHAESPTQNWTDYTQRAGSFHKDDLRALWGRDAIKGSRFATIDGVDHTIHGHSVRSTVTTVGNQHWIDTGSVFDEGSGKYGLTILEFDKETKGFTTHRIVRNSWEQSGFEHRIIKG